MNILEVDDEATSRKVMERMMRSIGRCQVVDSGTDAVEAFTAALQPGQPFDLVTLDVLMPGKDGMETLLDTREMEAALPPQSGS